MILYGDEHFHQLLDAMNKGPSKYVVFTDFSKAFNSVPKSAWLCKLKRLGFYCSFLSWPSTYLYNRFSLFLMLFILSIHI